MSPNEQPSESDVQGAHGDRSSFPVGASAGSGNRYIPRTPRRGQSSNEGQPQSPERERGRSSGIHPGSPLP
eukprot:2778976-Amphidinium_carterae.1